MNNQEPGVQVTAGNQSKILQTGMTYISHHTARPDGVIEAQPALVIGILSPG